MMAKRRTDRRGQARLERELSAGNWIRQLLPHRLGLCPSGRRTRNSPDAQRWCRRTCLLCPEPFTRLPLDLTCLNDSSTKPTEAPDIDIDLIKSVEKRS